MRGSGQRLPITLRFTRVLGTFSHTTCFPFSCALWACFSDRSVSGERSEPIGALMPHAALWVVQQTSLMTWLPSIMSFNAARGFVGGAAMPLTHTDYGSADVSMPHAALWVVQPNSLAFSITKPCCFNAARGFVGGAAMNNKNSASLYSMFQCRTRLCGWCNVIFERARPRLCGVSMPHAALWVVQR